MKCNRKQMKNVKPYSAKDNTEAKSVEPFGTKKMAKKDQCYNSRNPIKFTIFHNENSKAYTTLQP